MRRRMASRCGAIFGASQRRVMSTLPIVPPRARTSRSASRRKMPEFGALPSWVGVREVLTDVARANGAEQRVGEGVQGDVGVGVAFQRVAVGDLDAAQPDMVAGHQPVHIEALPGAHVGTVDRPLGHDEVLRGGELDVGGAAHHEGDRQARPFRDRGVVGHVVPAGSLRVLVRGQNIGKAETLRGLRPPQSRAIGRGGDAVVWPCPLERIGEGKGGDCAG